jgi:hypothetical protein
MALLVHLITRRPCAFLVPLVDGVKRNIEQCCNLISRKGTLRLSAGYVGDDWVHKRDQCRWFGGMVGNHLADIVAKYGDTGEVPQALTDYIKGREGYDYNEHGRAGNLHTPFIPDEIMDRFCVLGTADDHIAKLKQLKEIGVDQFAGYLQHDNKEKPSGSMTRRSCPRCVNMRQPRRDRCVCCSCDQQAGGGTSSSCPPAPRVISGAMRTCWPGMSGSSQAKPSCGVQPRLAGCRITEAQRDSRLPTCQRLSRR